MKKAKTRPRAKRKVAIKNLPAKRGRAEAVRGGVASADSYRQTTRPGVIQADAYIRPTNP